MKAPYVGFMGGIAPPARADPYVERAIPRKDPDTKEPLDPQGQGLPLGTVPKPDPLIEWFNRAQEISTRRVQAQTMREFNLRFRHMDGVQKVAKFGTRQSTNIRDLRDPAAAAKHKEEWWANEQARMRAEAEQGLKEDLIAADAEKERAKRAPQR